MDQFALDGVNRAHRLLRVPGTETEKDVTVDANGDVEIPTDFLALVAFDYDDNSEFYYQTYQTIRDKKKNVRDAGPTGRYFYSRRRDKFKFYPALTAGETLTIIYYGDPSPMAADEDAVPILYFAPDAVKYAALSYAADYFDDERAATFEGRFQQLVSEIKDQAYEQEASNLNQMVNGVDEFLDY